MTKRYRSRPFLDLARSTCPVEELPPSICDRPSGCDPAPTCWRDWVRTQITEREHQPSLTRGDPCACCGVGDGLGLEFDNGERVCYNCGATLQGGPNEP